MISNIIRPFFVCLLPFFLVACGGGTTGDASNYLVVEDQKLTGISEVEVSEIHLEQTAWVVVYESKGPQETQGGLENIIGKESFESGKFENVKVSLDRELIDGELLFIELRRDRGTIGEFDTATDSLISQSSVTSVAFRVFHSLEPYIDLGSGELVNNSLIVDNAIADQDSWLVAYTFDEEAAHNMGVKIGAVRLDQGYHQNISLDLLSGKGISLDDGEKIVVALHLNHTDLGEFDEFDTDNDSLLTSQGEEVLQVITLVGAP